MNMRKLRIKILSLLDFISDVKMVKIQYLIKLHRKLDLKNPLRYTEKLQYYKLYYRDELMRQCVDKYDVRKYVDSVGCSEILNDIYGVFSNVNEINYQILPNEFVIKDTLGGGSTSVICVKNKKELNINDLNKKIKKWIEVNPDIKHPGREWVYENKQHRIIIEKYLEQKNGDLADYKFFCFYGKVEYFYVRTNYSSNHLDGEMSFFDRNINYLPNVCLNYCKKASQKPNLDTRLIKEMMRYAEVLAKPFPHVRVDFYNIDGKIVFGELTFFNASGYMNFEPDSFDFEIGKYFNIEKLKENKEK